MCRTSPFASKLEIEQSGVRIVHGDRTTSVYLDNGCGGRSLVKRYRDPATAISIANLLAGARRVKDRKGGKSNAQSDRRSGKSGR
jgi:hypothetical protein